MLINRDPSPVETYNDIDGEVVNFFNVLRNNTQELIKAIALTPFSREEFNKAIDYEPGISEFERARRFYVRARQVRTGLAQKASNGRWANCVMTSRAGMAGAVSRWLGSIEDLPLIAMRLLRVQIESSEAIDVIKRYDSSETLFYCDPPYPHDCRSDINAYGFEMNDADHEELAFTLNNIEGKAALSTYDSLLIRKLYHNWTRIEAPIKNCPSVRKPRQEILLVNYDSEELQCRIRQEFLI